MKRRQYLAGTAAALAGPAATAMFGLSGFAGSRAANAAAYPGGPISVILPLQVGSASDVAVRRMVDQIGPKLGVSVIVENATGAGGLVGLEKLSKATADGQTLAALNNSIMTILPHLQPSKVRQDMRKDFVPIHGIANIPTFLGVKRGSPFKSVQELVDFNRKNPDKLTYASGGVGSPQHLAGEMLIAYSGGRMLHVPYKGATQAALALASGEVDVMTIALSLAMPYLPDKRVELIGYCGPERHPQFPELKTLAEQGVADYDYSSWIGLFALAGTPEPAVELLRKHAADATRVEAFRTQLVAGGLEPWAKSPVELAREVDLGSKRWAEVIKRANIPKS